MVLRIPALSNTFRLRGFYPLRLSFPALFDYVPFDLCGSSTPELRRVPVWALSLSLAATQEIDVSFSSSGYLDVSVRRVPSVALCIHAAVTTHYRRRVSPFGYPWVSACLRLTMAFRSLPRPSSALGAKASALCSY